MKRKIFLYTIIILFFESCGYVLGNLSSPSNPLNPLYVLFLLPKESTSCSSMTLTGTISDPNAQIVLSNHTVSISPAGVNITTDENGKYTVNMKAGTYTATVSEGATQKGTFTFIVPPDLCGGNVSVSITAGVIIVTINGATGNPETVGTPIFDVTSGTYNTDQTVSISTATSSATIYYTTDGSTPTSSSTLYSSAISVAGNGTNTTIKAIAIKSGLSNSTVASSTYAINYDTVAQPTFSPVATTYTADQSVVISTTTSGATIYYTTNGANPTTASTVYSTPISVAGNGTNTTIKAIAIKNGMNNSSVAEGAWTINYLTVATPTFSPSANTYSSDQTVNISTSTSGATIYYTTNGATPTTASTVYSTPISVAGNGTSITIKAIAVKGGLLDSSIAQGTWTIDTTIPTVSITAITSPYLSTNSGAINTKDISWSSNRNGTYTIRIGSTNCVDGTQLSSGSVTALAANTYTMNASSLSVGANTVRICVTDSVNSIVGNNTTALTRDDTAPTVTASPSSANSSTAVNVTLTCTDASSGCEKTVYTSNETDPTVNGVTGAITNGTQYSAQLTPVDNASTTYKFLARDNAGNVSTVQAGVYVVDTTVATVSIGSVSPSATVGGSTDPQLGRQMRVAVIW